MQNIMSELETLKLGVAQHPANFVIQGGYFESARGLDLFARTSLNRALELGSILRQEDPRNQITYNVLINDLGISCADNVCQISGDGQDEERIQSAIEEALGTASLQGIELSTTTERHMRNWGFRRLRKIFKTPDWQSIHPRLCGVTNDERTHWKLKSRLGEEILLFEENGPAWVAKCPIIMGAYYAFMLEGIGADTDVMSKVVIDFCSPSDKDKVAKGAEAAYTLFRPRGRRQDVVMPVLCDSSCRTMLPMPLFSMDLC